MEQVAYLRLTVETESGPRQKINDQVALQQKENFRTSCRAKIIRKGSQITFIAVR